MLLTAEGQRCERHLLFVDPVVSDGLPVDQLLVIKPQSDLLLSTFHTIAAVTDVTGETENNEKTENEPTMCVAHTHTHTHKSQY